MKPTKTRFYHWLLSRWRLYWKEFVYSFFRKDNHPHELALGAAVGVFIGFTPTFGLQMYLVWLLWSVFRLVKFRFNLGLALSFTWISNPFTIPFLIYIYFLSGDLLLNFLPKKLRPTEEELAFVHENLFSLELWGNFEKLQEMGFNLVLLYILPCLLGSLIWAGVFGLLSYGAIFWMAQRWLNSALSSSKKKPPPPVDPTKPLDPPHSGKKA